MDERELIRIIGTRARKTAQRRWNCPSDSDVASYLEQSLEPREKQRFEAHLAGCDFCLGMVGELVREQRPLEPVEAPARLVHKAIDALPMKDHAGMSRRWILVPALASIVAAGAVLLRWSERGRFVASVQAPTVETVRPPSAIPQGPAQPTEKEYVRKLSTSGPRLQLLEPRSESVVPRERLRFRWRALANTTYYEIRIVNSEGDLVWHEQAANTTAHLPPDLSLRTGRYFVWVYAYLNDGRTIKSEAMAFRILGSS
jgi:hypothetical protein